MKSLTVHLRYPSSHYQPIGHVPRPPLTLPVRVVDADGGVVAEGAISEARPANLEVPNDADPAFVRLTWPSGKTETQRVEFEEKRHASVTFEDKAISQNEWSAWAVPRVSAKSALLSSSGTSATGMELYHRVWLRMWTLGGGCWSEVPVEPIGQHRSEAAYQFDFDLGEGSWLLQFGGTRVPWTLVSLPGGGPCRVLLTPNASTDRRADPLRAVVTGFRPNTETLLEFLSRDSIRAASALARLEPLAERLLSQKEDDPIAAVAGAYFLLRTRGWSEVPASWFEHLYRAFPWIPDAAVIHCSVMVRGGLDSKALRSQARQLLKEAMRRGVPVFAEGLTLLQEAASVLRGSRRLGESDIFTSIEHLAASQAWAGAALSFYGRRPDAPNPEKLYGYPTDSGRAKPAAKRSSGRAAGKTAKTAASRRKRPLAQESLVLLKDIFE